MPGTKPHDRYRAPALDKGLDILELLAGSEAGLSQAEIAKALNRTTNEIYRMLDRLVRRNYVARAGGDRYELTLKLFALAHESPPIRRLVSHAQPVLQRIARQAEQSCHMVVLDRGAVVCIAQADAPGYWGFGIRVGSRIGLLNTGSGHVFLAMASAAERQMMLDEHEPVRDEHAPADLEEQLALVRERAYEIKESQQLRGVMNISVPVLGPNSAVLAVMTSPYVHRLDTPEALPPDAVLVLLQAASSEISRMVGALTG